VSGLSVFRYFPCFRSLLLVFAVAFSCTAQAQLCNGSLGDPVVNITFGSGGGTIFTPPNSYTYTSSSCPNDGYYTITNFTSNCFGNTWHTVTTDHTGNGSFMLVNASFNPGDFFVTTVTDLCPNTTYEFAAWIMNVLSRSGIQPNITFSIETPDSIVLKRFNTGDINSTSQPQWKQYGFFFTTPPDNAKIVLRITNNAPGGLGNDLALDDITFRPCGPMITAGIQGNSDTVDICEGNTNTYILNAAVSSGYISPVYQWQLSIDKGISWKDIPGATSISYQRQPSASAGNFWYRLAVVEANAVALTSCRVASNIVQINVHAKPLVNAGPNRIVITGSSAILSGKAEGENISYSWSPDRYINDINELDPTVSPVADIVYTLSAISSYGCTSADNVLVKVVTGIYIPTAFTPNNDGKNDTWKIPFLDPEFDAEVNVFNRNGQLVYHCKDAIVSWDGMFNGILQPTGVYVYLVTFKTTSLKLKGTVTLIR
jgi:gliding motility-associated-like protein